MEMTEFVDIVTLTFLVPPINTMISRQRCAKSPGSLSRACN